MEKEITMVHEETGSDGYVYYLNFYVGFTNVCADECVYVKTSNWIL